MTFTDGQSDTVCTPSRYGLLTGRYRRTTMKRGVMGAEGKCLIADGRMTLASFLRDNGYATAMVKAPGMDFPGTKATDWSKPTVDTLLDKGLITLGIRLDELRGARVVRGPHGKVPPTLFTRKNRIKLRLTITASSHRIRPSR